jgi:hypothetical protein
MLSQYTACQPLACVAARRARRHSRACTAPLAATQPCAPRPVPGFNVETIRSRGLFFTAWDVCGCDKIRPLWRHYTSACNAMVFVLNSNDHERLPAAREELQSILMVSAS